MKIGIFYQKRFVVSLFIMLLPLMAFTQSSFFSVKDYGAIDDGGILSTEAIQSAIDACAESGGGTVLFLAGRYISGTVYLKSHVNLHLESGAVLEGSKNLRDYPETFSGVRSYTDNYTNKSLIYAEELTDISITGKGIIDGNGASFKVEHMENDDGLRSKDNWYYYKSRPFMIRMINCEKILLRDIKIINSPMWVQHYLKCRNINIEGIEVISHVNDNNDGIDIDGCENVRISNCHFDSGDDAIVLKSTLDKPCKDVVISNCILSSNCNAFKLGTETNGGFQNVILNNCTIKDTRLAGIALEIVDGGILDGVNVSNIVMNGVGTAIFVRLGNRARPFADKKMEIDMGQLSNVVISNIQAKKVDNIGCSITGLPNYPVKDITLENIRITFEGGGTQELVNKEVEELPDAYPEYRMFGALPAYGFFIRHAENIKFHNVELDYNQPEARPAMIFDDVGFLELSDINARTNGKSPVMIFRDVRKSMITSNTLWQDTPFLHLTGPPSAHITLIGNDFSGRLDPISNENGSAVFLENNQFATDILHDSEKTIDCDPQFIDDRYIRIFESEEIENLRKKIIKAIWGMDHLPARKNAVFTKGIQNPLNPCSSLASVDRIEIPPDRSVSQDYADIRDLAYHFIPVKRNNRLVIFNPGHLCTLKSDPDVGRDYGTESTIRGLLEKGFDVLAVFMPHVSETDCDLDHCNIFNTPLVIEDYPATYGLRFFLDPTIVSLNYLMEINSYSDVNMVGLSGGGWTTNMIAAIDDRIKYSFSVAGSMPLYYRSAGSIGDVEQYLPQFYRDIAGYPDLYVLGAYGDRRKQIQVLNRKDDCCFGETQHDPGRDYLTDIRTFEKGVKDRLVRLDAEGHYVLVVDESAPNHQISSETLHKVILKELK
jgi:polygalacturonase